MSQLSAHFVRAVDENIRYWKEQLVPAREGSPEVVGELPNLLQAIRYGLALPATQPEAARLLAQVHRSIERAGWWSEWLDLCELALFSDVEVDWQTRVRLFNGRGVLRRHEDQSDLALADHRLAAELADRNGDDFLWAQAQYHCALDFARRHALSESESHAQAALVYFAEHASGSIWHAATLNSLGDIARVRGDYDRAAALLTKAVQLFEKLGDTTDLARALNNLGLTRQEQTRWSEAAGCYEAALHALEEGGDATTRSLLCINYGILFYLQEQYQQAEIIFREADTLALRQTGNTYLRGGIAQNIGSALMKQGSYIEAERHLNRAALLWRQSGNNLSLGNTLGTLAELFARMGDMPRAMMEFDEALRLLAGYPDQPWARQLMAEFQTVRQTIEEGLPLP